MHLNDPETIPLALACGKIVFHETSPWCQKGWGRGAEIEDRSAYITSQIGIQLLFAHLIPMCFSAEQVNGNYGY